MPTIDELQRIAEIEFSNIVKDTLKIDYKLRIILIDNSFVDAYLSQKLKDKFGFHWECLDSDNTIFRYDNFPDKQWQDVPTYPYHFHNGSQKNVIAAQFSKLAVDGFKDFMRFVQSKLLS